MNQQRTPIERILFKNDSSRAQYENMQRSRGFNVYFNYLHSTSSGDLYEVARVAGGAK
jgi:hypothetical protein